MTKNLRQTPHTTKRYIWDASQLNWIHVHDTLKTINVAMASIAKSSVFKMKGHIYDRTFVFSLQECSIVDNKSVMITVIALDTIFLTNYSDIDTVVEFWCRSLSYSTLWAWQCIQDVSVIWEGNSMHFRSDLHILVLL